MTKFTRRNAMKLGASAAATLPLLATAAKAATTHNVTIKSFKFDPADITIVNKGGAATLTFASAGSFDYFCKFHPNMKGKITIA